MIIIDLTSSFEPPKQLKTLRKLNSCNVDVAILALRAVCHVQMDYANNEATVRDGRAHGSHMCSDQAGARRLAHWRIAHRRFAQRRMAHRRFAHRRRRFAHPHLHICQLHSYLSLSSLLCCTVAPNV